MNIVGNTGGWRWNEPASVELVDLLAQTYAPPEARFLARQVTPRLGTRVNFNASSHDVWVQLLDAAAHAGREIELLERVLADHDKASCHDAVRAWIGLHSAPAPRELPDRRTSAPQESPLVDEYVVGPGAEIQHPNERWCRIAMSLDGKTVYLGVLPGRSYVSHELYKDLPLEDWYQPVDPKDVYAFPGQRPHANGTEVPVELYRRRRGDLVVRWRNPRR